MYHLQIDHDRNLLKATLTGTVTMAEARRGVSIGAAYLAQLHKGYSMLTDLSLLEELEVGVVSQIREAMIRCNAKGPGRIVRVIPDPVRTYGFNIMTELLYDPRVSVVTVETLDEALRCLDPNQQYLERRKESA